MADVARTLRALAEAVVPGHAEDPTLGAPEIEAERFITHYLELVIPGLSDGVSTILDGMAVEMRAGTAFADLATAERATVLEKLCTHDVAEMRELGDLLLALSIASVYGEWSGQDESGEVVRAPLGWDLTGWPGPVDGYRELLRRR